MKVLLDEPVPRGFARDLPGHAVDTVPKRGWAGKQNGERLELASSEFDVFVTVLLRPSGRAVGMDDLF